MSEKHVTTFEANETRIHCSQKGGPRNRTAHTLPTTDPASLVLLDQSLIDRHLYPLRLKPAHCSTADLFVF
jgi:hypothetical protein